MYSAAADVANWPKKQNPPTALVLLKLPPFAGLIAFTKYCLYLFTSAVEPASNEELSGDALTSSPSCLLDTGLQSACGRPY